MYRSKIVVPVVAQGGIFGALTFVRTDDSEPFDIAGMQAAEELGRRAGLARRRMRSARSRAASSGSESTTSICGTSTA
jgi:hypothetical protein